jgi:2-oxo-4-hydroxy-4-carboxy-5-ureidoimidazoline decarboxylase
MLTLDHLNAMPEPDFVAALAGVFEHSPWVAATAAGARPFDSVTALHAALMQAVEQSSEDVKLAFLRQHPALSPKAMADPALTAESRSEQGGLGMASLGDGLARFEAASAAYEARFALPYITCVRRMTPPFVLRGLEQRLTNTKTQEIAAALREIGFITRLRLVDRVSGPGMPGVAGHLSTHVLDTARGKAAAGIRIELLREGVMIKEGVTNQDGRTDEPLLHGEPLRMGRYELRFHVETYYAGWPNVTDPPWFDVIPIRVGIAEPEGHYHIPLLLNAWTYSTYRGS